MIQEIEMIAYHGSNKLFSTFDPEKTGEGVGAKLICKGIYLATSIPVANTYRNQVSTEDSDFTDKIYFNEEGSMLSDVTEVLQDMSGISEEIDHFIEDLTSEHKETRLVAERFLLNEANIRAEYGVVYEVAVPDREHLLVWEGDVDNQPFDVIELLRDLYGDDDIEEIYDEAMEDSPGGVSFDFFDDVFERALLAGVNNMKEELESISPDFDWSRLDRIISEHCPEIMPDEEEAGRALYTSLAHSLGSEDAAIDLFAEYGIHGVSSAREFTGHQGENEIIVAWREENAIIKNIVDPQTISLQNDYEYENDNAMEP